jgi:UDP-N-acetyl-2-amino-2-deoxyglucuronate dehydrogenase
MNPPRFALIGAAGFVAPRHMQAIKDVGGKLVAALDPHDSVGVLDKFDRETEFFVDEHRFERHLEKLRRAGQGVDWVAVCSPNYLHHAHVQLGLRLGAKVICEKPLVLNPTNLDLLADVEREYSDDLKPRVFTVLQLRHVESLQRLRALVRDRPAGPVPMAVYLDYITPRGPWYDRSWKSDKIKSGGIITNIGIHMLDLLIWLFGEPAGDNAISGKREGQGEIYFKNANVRWNLSLNGDRVRRVLTIDGVHVPIDGFEDLHTTVYRETLAGRGHGIEDARPAVELAARLRG